RSLTRGSPRIFVIRTLQDNLSERGEATIRCLKAPKLWFGVEPHAKSVQHSTLDQVSELQDLLCARPFVRHDAEGVFGRQADLSPALTLVKPCAFDQPSGGDFEQSLFTLE